MNRPSVEGAILVSPTLPFDLKWEGTRLILRPKEEYKEDQTYVITVTSEAKDLQGNAIKEPFNLAFSTGTTIGTGAIHGTVLKNGSPQRGMGIWLYDLESDRDISPWEKREDFQTVSGPSGNFNFSYLPTGRYRILAVEDVNRNQLWDPGKEALGLAYEDFILDSLSTSHTAILVMSERDTTGLVVTSCETLEGRTLKVNFTKEVSGEEILNAGHYSLTSAEGKKCQLELLGQVRGEGKSVLIELPEATAGQKLDLKVRGLTAIDGTSLDTAGNGCSVSVSTSPDPVSPKLIAQIPQTNDSYFDPGQELAFFFSELMSTSEDRKYGALTDSSGREVKGNWTWKSGAELSFAPQTPLVEGRHYTLIVKGSELHDLSGNTVSDSTYKISFRTVSSSETGSVTGKISFGQAKLLGSLVLNLKSLDSDKIYEMRVSQGETFEFARVLPGRYLLDGFIDFDHNHRYSPGSLKPFIPSEPYNFQSDTVVVRARWATEDVKLKFE